MTYVIGQPCVDVMDGAIGTDTPLVASVPPQAEARGA